MQCAGANGKVTDSVNSIHEVSLHYSGRGKGGKGDALEAAPPDIVLQEIDAQELNRVFVRRHALFWDLIRNFHLQDAFGRTETLKRD